ncbi:MAG: heparinase II/III-family protein [Bacteroidales bacterium]|nr:heparinase II/III-family protein [Bacteroidales bacterium]
MKYITVSGVWLSVMFLLLSVVAEAQLKYTKDIKNLPPHPRILLLQGEEQRIKTGISSDPVWAKIHQSIMDECDKITLLPEPERKQTGRRLLSVSREVMRRIFYLSYACRIEGQEKYLKKAERDMLAVAAFENWNPSHFLDVAEMTVAMAIGYDWLYHSLPASSRETIRAAILSKGIDPSLGAGNNGWLKSANNWNQVCNAGMTFGALAVFEDMPELSRMIIDRAVETIRIPMGEYAPDGAYPEGYGYWEYGTGFNVMFLSAVEKALGTDYGLTQLPGFTKTARYLENMTGPLNLSFSYSDTGQGAVLHTAMFWFASKLNDLSLLWNEKKYLEGDKKHTGNRLLPTVMIWGSGVKTGDITPPEELFWTGGGATPVAMMRTSWTDPDAVYVGFKGGSASVSHAHMDAGSFVMDANGVRWAMDFGMQDYHSLESKGVDLWNSRQNAQRWQVFRYNNFAHNTLTVNGQLHQVKGRAHLQSWSSSPAFMNAVSDMTEVFEGLLSSCVRGVAIVDRRYVVVRDEIKTSGREARIRWTMLTGAEAKITGKNAIELTENGKKLKIEVAEPAKVTMKTWTTTSANDFDAPNPGTVLVGFEATVPANSVAALSVKLIPQGVRKTVSKVPELAQWAK